MKNTLFISDCTRTLFVRKHCINQLDHVECTVLPPYLGPSDFVQHVAHNALNCVERHRFVRCCAGAGKFFRTHATSQRTLTRAQAAIVFCVTSCNVWFVLMQGNWFCWHASRQTLRFSRATIIFLCNVRFVLVQGPGTFAEKREHGWLCRAAGNKGWGNERTPVFRLWERQFTPPQYRAAVYRSVYHVE